MTTLEQCPALVLNADYRPLSYFPLSVWSWQDAVKAVFRDTVTILSEYDRTVRSPSHEFKLPSVIVLKDYVAAARKPAFTRYNVFLRDEWRCQYCSRKARTSELTFDHVIPKSRGGKTSWPNIVTACRTCNIAKGHKLPGECRMYPVMEPRQPTVFELQDKGRKFPPNFLHKSWGDFLYWDSELEQEDGPPGNVKTKTINN